MEQLLMSKDDKYTFDITEMSTTITLDSMSNEDIYITTDDTISTLTIDDTIDIDLTDMSWSGITISTIDFEDCMPDLDKVKTMCNDYPALEKAYENFKTIYKMVHQDWQGRQDDEDGQLPF